MALYYIALNLIELYGIVWHYIGMKCETGESKTEVGKMQHELNTKRSQWQSEIEVLTGSLKKVQSECTKLMLELKSGK
jgi:hypothetical protein